MKQPGVLLILVTFVAAVSFVVASEQYKQGRMATTTLNGMNQLPELGDPNGTGVFKLRVDSAQNQICYELTTSNIGNVTGVQIHTGDRSAVGPTFIALKANSIGRDCLAVDANKIGELNKNPTNFYVSVQTEEFPNGAIRGQLGR
jgi:hypothetical protein